MGLEIDTSKPAEEPAPVPTLTFWTSDDGTVVPAGDPEAMYPIELERAEAEKRGLVEKKKAAKPADKKRSPAKNKKG